VLWSRTPNPQSAQQASSLGVSQFLTAPVAPEDFRAALAAAARESQQAAAAEAEAEAAAQAEAEAAARAAAEAAAEAAARAAAEPPSNEPPVERSRRMHDVPAAPPPVERRNRMHDVAPAPTPTERTRRMHDVAPAPTPTERTRKPHDVAPAPSLAERARRAAQQQDSQQPDPSRMAHTRQGALILTADNIKPIRSRMEALEREVGSQCILLADRAGMLLVECGITSTLPTMVLLPLLSTSFSTAGQISQMLREKEFAALYVHEGVNYDVYCFDVLQHYMLVIIFSKSAGRQAAKIGSVWVFAKRAIRDIEDLLNNK
jgi:hypothetical protein